MFKSLIILALLFSCSVLWAQSAGQKGLGLMFGNPTGVVAKYWLSSDQAIDAAAGMSIGKHTNFSMHSDYLWHSKDYLYINETHPLDLYYGLGGRMEFADNIELGLRVPVGVAHNFQESNADTFLEIAPILDFLDTKGVEIHLAVGARYYFD